MTRQEYEYLQERFSKLLAKKPYGRANEKEAYRSGVLAAKSVLKDVYEHSYSTAKDDGAADAIEALQAEAQFYKALADEWQASAENKERLLGLYRAEQAKHFYSATDNNGRVIQNPCVCMNIPVFPDSSEIPNS